MAIFNARILFGRSSPVSLLLNRSFHKTNQLSDTFVYQQHGKREIVGFGLDGSPQYSDRLDYPYPAVRFRENDEATKKLRQKESSDWNKLSLDEKKALYRASFCQTFSELDAPTGHWKVILAIILGGCSLSMVIYICIKKFVYKPLPHTFSEEWREASLQKMIDQHAEPITGVGSKWDYEKNRWKA